MLGFAGFNPTYPKRFVRQSGENETLSVLLAGNLARFEAREIVVEAQVSSFPMVNLAFAWTQAADVPLILGQANFLFEFEVCLFRARSEFEVRPKQVE